MSTEAVLFPIKQLFQVIYAIWKAPFWFKTAAFLFVLLIDLVPSLENVLAVQIRQWLPIAIAVLGVLVFCQLVAWFVSYSLKKKEAAIVRNREQFTNVY